MKYTKKMKLVELRREDARVIPSVHGDMTVSDDNYSKPKVLSLLDKQMSVILQNDNKSDFDKWSLYKQTLQRYLNFIENGKAQTIQSNMANYKEAKPNDTSFDSSLLGNDISGIFPLENVSRNSLDNISMPSVREFFEKVRDKSSSFTQSSKNLSMPSANVNQEIAKSIQPLRRKPRKKRDYNNLSSPRTTRARGASKRRAELALTSVKPCKVALFRDPNIESYVDWNRCNLRS